MRVPDPWRISVGVAVWAQNVALSVFEKSGAAGRSLWGYSDALPSRTRQPAKASKATRVSRNDKKIPESSSPLHDARACSRGKSPPGAKNPKGWTERPGGASFGHMVKAASGKCYAKVSKTRFEFRDKGCLRTPLWQAKPVHLKKRNGCLPSAFCAAAAWVCMLGVV